MSVSILSAAQAHGRPLVKRPGPNFGPNSSGYAAKQPPDLSAEAKARDGSSREAQPDVVSKVGYPRMLGASIRSFVASRVSVQRGEMSYSISGCNP